MDLSLGRRADYAIRAAVALASVTGQERRKAREIAEETAVPPSYLPQILAALARGGLVSSAAGRHGGYALARPPEAVTLLDVVNVVEGDPSSNRCVLRPGPCASGSECAVHVPWWSAQQALLTELGTTTLAQVVGTSAGRPTR